MSPAGGRFTGGTASGLEGNPNMNTRKTTKTTTSGTRIVRTAALSVATAVASITLLMPGSASAQDNAPGPRLERACLRIPNLELRTTNLIKRLEGDDQTLGSLAWLQRQIDRTTAAGRTQLAQVLTNRLAVRTKTLEILHQRELIFPDLRERCAAHGVQL